MKVPVYYLTSALAEHEARGLRNVEYHFAIRRQDSPGSWVFRFARDDELFARDTVEMLNATAPVEAAA